MAKQMTSRRIRLRYAHRLSGCQLRAALLLSDASVSRGVSIGALEPEFTQQVLVNG